MKVTMERPAYLALRAAGYFARKALSLAIAAPTLILVMAAYALGELVIAPVRLGDPRSPDRRDEEDGAQ